MAHTLFLGGLLATPPVTAFSVAKLAMQSTLGVDLAWAGLQGNERAYHRLDYAWGLSVQCSGVSDLGMLGLGFADLVSGSDMFREALSPY